MVQVTQCNQTSSQKLTNSTEDGAIVEDQCWYPSWYPRMAISKLSLRTVFIRVTMIVLFKSLMADDRNKLGTRLTSVTSAVLSKSFFVKLSSQ